MPLRLKDEVAEVLRQLHEVQGQQLQLIQAFERMMMAKHENGKSVGGLIFWMLGVCVAILVAVGSAYAAYVNSKISGYDQIVLARGERLTVLETNYLVIQTRLAKMDEKLDQLLAHSRWDRK